MKTESLAFSASEIRSGFLVAASGLILIGLLFLAGNVKPLQKTRPIEIVFHYVGGLEKNAPVHFAGYEVGRVTDIRLERQSENQVVVTAHISKDILLKKNSRAFIDVLGFMGEKLLELTPGSPQAAPLSPNETVEGVDPILLPALIKQGAELTEDFKKINDSLKSLIADLDQVVGENRPEVEGILKNLNESSENLKEMTRDLKWHPWKLLRKGKEKNPVEEKKPSPSS